ncbi:MAG: DUF1289 domain-containing protein [Pseudomonadales bacterium]|nr:DUF1289 domain-containing protein [Pseudomonadales bacterium]
MMVEAPVSNENSQQASDKTAKPENPCVRNCCLDTSDVCLGCGRTLIEITGWTRLNDSEKQVVLRRAERRKQDRTIW